MPVVGSTAKGHKVSLQQFFGRWQEQAQAADESGRWRRWVAAQPALAEVGSAGELGRVVTDRAQPGRGNELLHALVRVGSADGGVDESAVTLVASLLVPGGDRLVRSLSALGPDVDCVVAGQLWLQVREYPWRRRPRAVAKNALMDTRRAVLADYGARTGARPPLVRVSPPELVEVVDRKAGALLATVAPDVELLELLVWARARGVLAAADAALLWELVVLASDEHLAPGAARRARGVSSLEAGRAVAASSGVTTRSVRRRRDRAVGALRLASADFEGDCDVHPDRVLVLTGTRALSREGR